MPSVSVPLKGEKGWDILMTQRRVFWAQDKHNQLSPHFLATEFYCHDGSPCPITARPALVKLSLLEPLRAKFGTNPGPPLGTFSTGGALHSQHIYEDGFEAWQPICGLGRGRRRSGRRSPEGVAGDEEQRQRWRRTIRPLRLRACRTASTKPTGPDQRCRGTRAVERGDGGTGRPADRGASSKPQRIMDATTILEASVTFEGEWSSEASKVIARLYRQLAEARTQTEFVEEPERPSMTGKERATDEVYERGR